MEYTDISSAEMSEKESADKTSENIHMFSDGTVDEVINDYSDPELSVINFNEKSSEISIESTSEASKYQLEKIDMGNVTSLSMNDQDDLPLFATPEARKIHIENKLRESKLEAILKKISDLNERIKVMKDHYHNVEQEVEYASSLLNAKNAEIATEKHLKELASRELSRMNTQKKRLQEEINNYQDGISMLQNKISLNKELLEEYKLQINWNQEELQQYLLLEKKKEDDFLALEKYSRADESKVREITLEIERLNQELVKRREREKELDSVSIVKELEAKRLSDDCAKTHKERHEVVELWEKSIEEMKRRDKEVSELGEQYASVKTEKSHLEEELVVRQKRYVEQQSENREIESKNEYLSRVMSKNRDELVSLQTKLTEIKDEFSSLKNEVISTSEKIMMKKSENLNLNQSIETKRIQLEKERATFKRIKSLIDDANNVHIAVEDKVKRYEAEVIQKENEYELKLQEVKNLKDNLFKEEQHAYELKQQETRVRLEISGNKLIAKNYDTQLLQLDKEISRQQEYVYNADFQIQQIERKISRGLGVRSDEDKKRLSEQVAILENKLNQVKDKKKLLQNQFRKLQNDYNISALRRDEIMNTNSKLTDKLTEYELQNRVLDEQIKRDLKTNEEMNIQNDLLRLEVRKLRENLQKKTQSVYDLQLSRQKLLLSIEQQKCELRTQYEFHKSEVKIVNEEKHKVIMELKSKESNMNNLIARFEVMSRPQEDGNTQAHYVIMAAQKREDLRRQGDELDRVIQKSEKELLALQLTLDHLNGSNSAYKTSLLTLHGKNDEFQKLKQCEQSSQICKDELMRTKRECRVAAGDLEEDRTRLEVVRNDLEQSYEKRASLEATCDQLEIELQTMDSQLDDIKSKTLRRVHKHRRSQNEKSGLDATCSDIPETVAEKAARADILKDTTQNVLYTLGQLAVEFPEIADELNDYLTSPVTGCDLKIPTRPPYANDNGRGGRGKAGLPISTPWSQTSLSTVGSESRAASMLRHKTTLHCNLSSMSLPGQLTSMSLHQSLRGSASSIGSRTSSAPDESVPFALKTTCFVPEFN